MTRKFIDELVRRAPFEYGEFYPGPFSDFAYNILVVDGHGLLKGQDRGVLKEFRRRSSLIPNEIRTEIIWQTGQEDEDEFTGDEDGRIVITHWYDAKSQVVDKDVVLVMVEPPDKGVEMALEYLEICTFHRLPVFSLFISDDELKLGESLSLDPLSPRMLEVKKELCAYTAEFKTVCVAPDYGSSALVSEGVHDVDLPELPLKLQRRLDEFAHEYWKLLDDNLDLQLYEQERHVLAEYLRQCLKGKIEVENFTEFNEK